MQPKLFIVTGVNGIGKSTVITELVTKLDPTLYKIYDFDARGVPDNAGKSWRESETAHWLKVAKQNAAANIATIVCGFMKVADIKQAMTQVLGVQVVGCLMDGSPEVVAERLMSRYQTSESLIELERTTGKTPEKFVGDNVWVSTKFREAAEEEGFNVIDTGEKSPAEVADSIIEWLG